MKHGKVESLGDRWANLERQLKDEGAAIAKLREQLKQHEDCEAEENKVRERPDGPRQRHWAVATSWAAAILW